MRADPAKVLDFIGKSQNVQFCIPVYQRMYSWEKEHCEKLWKDIIKIGENEKFQAHFIGSIMYIENNHYSQSSMNKLSVIDGQQRLTTLTLLLIALSDILKDEEEILEKFSKIKIKNRYLINPDEKNEKKYKLILSQTDNDTLISLLDKEKIEPQNPSLKIKENFQFLKDKLEQNKDKLEIICKGIDKLSIIDISLEREKDDPQLIFESMNSTGKNLTQTDLIRNYILMSLEPDRQTGLYEKYWRAMELEFGQENYEGKFDFFVRHYLTLKDDGKIPNINKIYEAFKNYHQSTNIDIEKLLQDLQNYSKYYCAMAFKKETDKQLLFAFEELLILEADVVYPFLLQLYNDYRENVLSKEDFIRIIKTIESYIFRRSICGIATNALNKVFANFAKIINKEKYLESILAHFCLLKTSSVFPKDDQFTDDLSNKNIYERFKKKNYLLDKLENFNRKEKVSINEYTIEHIMPQRIENNKEWRKELGENWQEIHDQYLHTLGNLTLTGYNSEYSNRPFREKRDIKGGFKESPLQLNEMLRNAEFWNEKTIKQRAKDLSNKALEIWQYPKIDEETLKDYKNKKEKTSYTLEDHPYLVKNEKNKKIFEILRKEIMALDKDISEEILKLYIAYKFDTNFVDVIPQEQRLKLSINIHIDELNDPKKIAHDVTEKGRWGNGKIEVFLSSIDDISYCLGLIRQALEKQQE